MSTLRRITPAYAVVFAAAFGMRLFVPLAGQGLVANYSYDASVYYSAGAALVHGRLPYRDFVLLHPPGVALAVSPAALIGRLTTDHAGFALTTLLFVLMGAASAVLVTVVARRLGVGWRAATAGGLFYALWLPSVRNEYMSRLEPLGNLLLLGGLVGFTGIGGRHSRRSAVLCGAGLGAAVSVKIWYAVPAAVVVGFLVAQRRAGDARRVVLAAGGAVLVLCGPFAVTAPSPLWRMVVADQLGRDQANPVRALLLLQDLPPGVPWPVALLLDAVLLAAVALLVVAARRSPRARLPAALLLATAALVLVAPTWFFSYFNFLTPAAALCVAVGAAAAATARRVVRVAGAAVVAVALVAPATRLWRGPDPARTALPSAELASAVAGVRCVMSDSPMALIGLNALSRSLANGCPAWIDVSGRTYEPDMDVRGDDGRRLPRRANPRWQRALRDYLLSGDAVIVIRPGEGGMSATTWAEVSSGGVLASDGRHAVYRVAPQSPA